MRSKWDVENQVGITRGGDPIRFEVWRGDERMSLTATVTQSDLSLLNERLAGAEFVDIDSSSRASGRIQGVLVRSVERGSTAWNRGLREGDIITRVNRGAVTDLRTFLLAVNDQTGQNFVLEFVRGSERWQAVF